MDKSPDAFRTISEVAEWLDVPTHVLRFWESRFAQIKPVKRAGGRRYYRPSDMRLIGGIKKLLHDDGMTIRGVQKLLREEGIRHVSGFSRPLEHELGMALTGQVVQNHDIPANALESMPFLPPASDKAVVPAAEAEEMADAAWGQENAAVAAATPAAPDDAKHVAFGSVREPDVGSAPRAAPAEEAEPALDLGVPDVERAPEREPVFDLEPPEAEEPDEPEPEPLPPLIADVPDTDPEDDDEAHRCPPGLSARVLLGRRPDFASDGVRLEEIVEALRALRGKT